MQRKRKKHTQAVALISPSLANVLPLHGGALHTVLQPAPWLWQRLNLCRLDTKGALPPTARCGAIIQLAAPLRAGCHTRPPVSLSMVRTGRRGGQVACVYALWPGEEAYPCAYRPPASGDTLAPQAAPRTQFRSSNRSAAATQAPQPATRLLSLTRAVGRLARGQEGEGIRRMRVPHCEPPLAVGGAGVAHSRLLHSACRNAVRGNGLRSGARIVGPWLVAGQRHVAALCSLRGKADCSTALCSPLSKADCTPALRSLLSKAECSRALHSST